MNLPTIDTIRERCRQAEEAGLVRLYIPNGTAMLGMLERCSECRHNIDDLENPKPARLTPPHSMCAWGIMDRIQEASLHNRYGYGTSYHQPGEVTPEGRCLRFVHKDDPNGGDHDPPKPDIPGQLTFDDINVPVEPEHLRVRQMPKGATK